jgi:myo-inositol 2-dehydrogenase / D-chiro-inositol 1-dehydrogenase
VASDRVGIALVGAGRIGSIHLGALQGSDEIDLIGVVEPYAPTREALRGQGVALFQSVEELLSAQQPEGVLIAAPSDQHPTVVTQFAEAGVPMLCEKPLGVMVEQAITAARSAEQAGVLLQIGYWRRFVPELGDLRRRILAGELGDIYALTCLQWDHDLPSEQFRSHSGGITVDMGVHEFDQIRWLLGQEFEWVTATAAGTSTRDRAPHDPDAVTILGRLSGGTAVTISLGRRFPHEDSCWIEVWGTQGYERITFMWDEAGDEVFRASMRRQAEAFARAVRGGGCEGAQGRDAVAALTVAGMSARSLADPGSRVTAEVVAA